MIMLMCGATLGLMSAIVFGQDASAMYVHIVFMTIGLAGGARLSIKLSSIDRSLKIIGGLLIRFARGEIEL